MVQGDGLTRLAIRHRALADDSECVDQTLDQLVGRECGIQQVIAPRGGGRILRKAQRRMRIRAEPRAARDARTAGARPR